MSDEEIKRLILARRAAFVAAAVASLAVASCEPKPADPGPCLSAPYDPNAQPPPNPNYPPQVCLSPLPPPPPDAGGGATEAPPQPCLSGVVPPKQP